MTEKSSGQAQLGPTAGSSIQRLPQINRDRLWQSIQDLAHHGEYKDERSGLMGVSRLTLTPADEDARAQVKDWMEEAGLVVRVDNIGNMFGRRGGTDPDLPPVIMGSHIDSVATAGAFDGPLGVLGAIEIIRTLNENDVVTLRSIEVASFTEEEGARFGTDMLGSAVASGRITIKEAEDLRDRNGIRLGDELRRCGYDKEQDALLVAPHAYVECHIEQGPILAEGGFDIGVVTGSQAISWQEISITGVAAHAGTTPTKYRADAGLAAAAIVMRLRAMVDSGEFGQLRATVGHLALQPDLVNIVPDQAELTVDLRNPDDGQIEAAERDLGTFFVSLQKRFPGIEIATRRMARTSHVPFDSSVQELIESVATGLGLSHTRLLSGAGHDAQELAAICPTAMVFVRGEFDGISHTPREYSTPEACEQGVNVLAGTVLALANQPIDIR